MYSKDRTFVDSGKVTHEKVHVYDSYVIKVSLCGTGYVVSGVEVGMMNNLYHATTNRSVPTGVNCMSCLVARARLEAYVAEFPEWTYDRADQVGFSVRIATWFQRQ